MLNYYGMMKDFDQFLDKMSLDVLGKECSGDNREILKHYRTVTIKGPRQSGKTLGALLFHNEAHRSVYITNLDKNNRQLKGLMVSLKNVFGKELSEHKQKDIVSVKTKDSYGLTHSLFKVKEDGSLEARYETYILDLGGGPVSNAIRVMLANHADPSKIKIFEL